MPRRSPSRSSGDAAPGTRPLRVGEEIRHALSAILSRGDLHDPVLAGRSITVSEVRVSPDLMNATAFVVPLGGGGEDMDEVMKALKRAAPYLRHEVIQEVKLRRAPALSFQPDNSFDYAKRIDVVLRAPDVRRDLDLPEPPSRSKKPNGKKKKR
jgi:ribosome-binding factor A